MALDDLSKEELKTLLEEHDEIAKLNTILKKNNIRFKKIIKLKKSKNILTRFKLSSLNKKNRIKDFKLYIKHASYNLERIIVHDENFYQII